MIASECIRIKRLPIQQQRKMLEHDGGGHVLHHLGLVAVAHEHVEVLVARVDRREDVRAKAKQRLLLSIEPLQRTNVSNAQFNKRRIKNIMPKYTKFVTVL